MAPELFVVALLAEGLAVIRRHEHGRAARREIEPAQERIDGAVESGRIDEAQAAEDQMGKSMAQATLYIRSSYAEVLDSMDDAFQDL